MKSEEIVARWIDLERDGGVMRTYVATPVNANETTPTIVLAMHLSGVDENMRSAAERFAASGFAVAIPDLYARFDAPDGGVEKDHKAFIPFAQKLDRATVDPDVRAAAACLRTAHPHSKMAIAGFCMGGVMALARTIGYRDLFEAAAVWYGRISIDPKQIEIPLVASYGADDAGIPIANVHDLEAAVRVPHDIRIYEGAGHAFCDETRAAYNENAASDSWRRTLAFLHRFLG